MTARETEVRDVGREQHSPRPFDEDPQLAPQRRHLRKIVGAPQEPCGQSRNGDSEYVGDAVAVTDRAGQPLAVLRDNLAGAHTSLTAINKAYTAASFRTDTSELAATTQAGKPSSGIRQLPQVVAVGGGLMVRAKGSLVGAIAVSGAPNGDADEACAKAGAAAINDAIELE